jgi:hypothetical protein
MKTNRGHPLRPSPLESTVKANEGPVVSEIQGHRSVSQK